MSTRRRTANGERRTNAKKRAAKMCDLKRITLFWYELLPYVDVVPKGNNIINRTGVLYEFFKESLADCCGSQSIVDHSFSNVSLPNQQAVLNSAHEEAGTVGMPISLDAEFPYVPVEFVAVFETDGLFWVKVREPKHDAVALGGISSTGLPILLVVMTMTGYASVFLWLLELLTNRSKEASKSFMRGVFESYWCAFISATTVGYGDKVPRSSVAKMFTMLWIIFGICLMSTFTAIITTVMSSFLAPDMTKPKPFYDEFIGVLDGSFDYLVLVKKRYPDTTSLTEALNNGSTFNIVMDKHAYWIYRAKIHQNQSFEFQPGVQNPTSIGYIYNTKNESLLRCLKDYAVQNQMQVSVRLQTLVKEAIASQPPDKVTDQVTMFFGPYTYSMIASAVGVLVGLCILGAIIDLMLRRANDNQQTTNAEPTEDSFFGGKQDTPNSRMPSFDNGADVYTIDEKDGDHGP